MPHDLDILTELKQAGAILHNRHFVYKSGRHGSSFINMDPLFPNTALMMRICDLLVAPFFEDVETVAAPATGGVVLSTLTAASLVRAGISVRETWADKVGQDDFAFERAGFARALAGKWVLVVEDLLTTGGSTFKVCRQAEKHGAKIIGVSAICNRGAVTAKQLGVPRLQVLATVSGTDFWSVDAAKCPLCRDHVPIVEDPGLGHADRFKGSHPDYPGGYVRVLTNA